MRILSALSIFFTIFIIIFNYEAAANTSKEAEEKAVFQAISKKEWGKANALAQKSKNIALQKIVLSQQYLDCSYQNNNFAGGAKFLLQNPSWPQRELIQIRTEQLLNEKTDKQLIVNFFSKKSPTTSKGHKYYAYAAAEVPQKLPNFSQIIKNGLIYGSFSETELKQYHDRYKKILTIDDYKRKIEHLLIQHKITEAKRVFPYVDDKSRKIFNTHIALIKKPQESDAIMKSITSKEHSAGIIYQYLSNKKKENIRPERISQLVKSVNNGKNAGDKIWSIQNYIAREYITQKKYRDAYIVVSFNLAQSPANKAEAAFLAGWLALEYLKKPQVALKHFQILNKVVTKPISKSRGLYWLARTEQKLGHLEKEVQIHNQNVKNYPYTFYGQASAIEINAKKILLPQHVDFNNYKIKANSPVLIDRQNIFQASRLISQYSSNYLSQLYLEEAANHIDNVNQAYDFVYTLTRDCKLHHISWFAKYALYKNILITNCTFPIPYKKQERPVEAALAYSIVKQESSFYKHAVSQSNAKGLMQLLEGTAKDMANKLSMKYESHKLLNDEQYNMQLGSAYLRHMLDYFKGSYILAIAAYNAGPGNMNRCIKKIGDPRDLKHHHSVINWIEQMPYVETRNYIQRVMENLQVYRNIISPNEPFRLKYDLLNK